MFIPVAYAIRVGGTGFGGSFIMLLFIISSFARLDYLHLDCWSVLSLVLMSTHLGVDFLMWRCLGPFVFFFGF